MGHFLWRRGRCLTWNAQILRVKSIDVAPMVVLHEHTRASSPHQGDRFSFFGMTFVILSAGSTAYKFVSFSGGVAEKVFCR